MSIYKDRITHADKPLADNSGCSALRFNDTLSCGRCGLQWDINEQPVKCLTASEAALKKIKGLDL